MQGVILAAGKGTRLKKAYPKALTDVLGLTLIERSILTLKAIGIKDIIIVVGFRAEDVKKHLAQKRFGVKLTFVENSEYNKGNGLSVLKAVPKIKTRFVLVMVDHIFEPDSIRGILHQSGDLVIGIDTNPRHIDVKEATKVKVEDGRVTKIGKGLKRYDGVDVGLFIVDPKVFNLVRKSIVVGKDTWSECAEAAISEWHVGTYNLNGSFWYDIDTPSDLENAEKLMLKFLIRDTDGIVSRNLNRKLSLRLTKTLVKTSITPNQITIISFIIALISAFLFIHENYVFILTAGVLVQFSSIIDGCDGEIARLKFMGTKYGAWFDACIDRYADAAIIVGIIYGVWVNKNLGIFSFLEHYPNLILLVGLLALLGSIMVSYSRARYETSYSKKYIGSKLEATRDVRMFIIMIVALMNQIFIGILILAIICNFEVFRRLAFRN